MALAPLVLFAAFALTSATAPDAASTALVEKLGSPEPAERAAAARSLSALGRDALPALRKAAQADDPGLRKRAAALWETIQRDLMVRPSLVRLTDQARQWPELIDNLEAQTGLALRIDQSPQQAPGAIGDPAPVPFWTALERLGLRGAHLDDLGHGKLPTLKLSTDAECTFTSISGPFRVALTGLHRHRDHQLVRGQWVRIDRFGQRINVPGDESDGDSVRYFGGLDIMVEPRQWFTLEAPARLTEASDDLGQSLVPEADTEAKLHDNVHFAVYSSNGVARTTTEFRLKPTERTGRVARLRGVVPVMLQVRRPEPTLLIPLREADGKTFHCADADFTIKSVVASAKDTTVALTAQLNVDNADLPDNPDIQLISSRMQVMGHHQLELTDADGSVVGHTVSGGGGGKDSPALFRWTLNTSQNGPATHLRYYGMVRARSEAVFEFRNIPLP